MVPRALFTWTPFGCCGLQEHWNEWGMWWFYHVSRPEMDPPHLVFSVCLSLGYKQHQNDPGYYLVASNDGDDDNGEKSSCTFKYSYIIWSSNGPKQYITYVVLPMSPEHQIKHQAPFVVLAIWGSFGALCPWFKCGHLPLHWSIRNVNSQQNLREYILVELY